MVASTPAGRSPRTLSLGDVRGLQRHPHLSDDSTYAALFMRRISPLLTWLVVRFTPLSANAVTTAAIASGVVAPALLLVPGPLPYILAVVLLQFAFLCDVSDGEVARIRGTASRRGQYLDLIGHAAQDRALQICAAVLLVRLFDGALPVVALALVCLAFNSPIGVHARARVTGAFVVDDPVHGIRRPIARPAHLATAAGLYYAYRRLSFVWSYPAAMNLFCVAILLDAARLALGASSPLAVPVTYLVFGPTLALRQVANAMRLLRAANWN